MGRWYGSLNNRIDEIATKGQPEPTVGMGATLLLYSDRHAATITNVFKVGALTYVDVQRDKAKRIDSNGFSESQAYEYEADTDGPKETYRFDGKRWVGVRFNATTKRWNKVESSGLRIGERDEYYDFSF